MKKFVIATENMSEYRRLELIAEAVRYCQRVRDMGMPKSAYSKALREPVHFLWELRHGSKKDAARYWSENALGYPVNSGNLVYDHAIPFVYQQRALLSLEDVNVENVREILSAYEAIAYITKEEDAKLRALGLNHKMPDAWDSEDPLARYLFAAIQIVDRWNA